jgi:hypothetical protein
MKTYFLIGWNDEYINLRIADGPFKHEEKEARIKREIIKMLIKVYGYTAEKAEKIYNTIVMGGKYTDMKGEDINLCIWPDGATLQYGSCFEDRIEVIEYDMIPSLEVDTPMGTIHSIIHPDKENPGIATLIKTKGEPGVMIQYNPESNQIISKIYTKEDSEGEPKEFILS